MIYLRADAGANSGVVVPVVVVNISLRHSLKKCIRILLTGWQLSDSETSARVVTKPIWKDIKRWKVKP